MGADSTGNQTTENLDSSVSALLEDAQRSCRNLSNPLGGAETGPTEAPGTLNTQVDRMVNAAGPATAQAASPPALTHDGLDPSLEVGGDLSQLDDDLASLSDGLVAEQSLAAEPAAPPPRPASTPAPVAAPAASRGTQDRTPTPQPAPATPSQGAVTVPPPANSEQGLPPVRDAARAIASAISPVALQALSVLSFPLRNKPRVVRDTVGWLAAWTLFLSGGLWIYVAFFHEPAGPVATAPALDFIGAEGKQPRSHSGDDHGSAHATADAEGHGESGAAEEHGAASDKHETEGSGPGGH